MLVFLKVKLYGAIALLASFLSLPNRNQSFLPPCNSTLASILSPTSFDRELFTTGQLHQPLSACKPRGHSAVGMGGKGWNWKKEPLKTAEEFATWSHSPCHTYWKLSLGKSGPPRNQVDWLTKVTSPELLSGQRKETEYVHSPPWRGRNLQVLLKPQRRIHRFNFTCRRKQARRILHVFPGNALSLIKPHFVLTLELAYQFKIKFGNLKNLKIKSI